MDEPEGLEELEHYEESIKWLEEATQDFNAWFARMQTEAQTDQQRRRMYLFLARFSDILDVVINCHGCGVTLLRGMTKFRCLSCLDVNVCNTCYTSGVKLEGHSETHDVIKMRFICDGCDSFIVGTRYHCNECEDFDLCIGCHSSGRFPESHSATHKVTKFPLTTSVENKEEIIEDIYY